MPRDVGLEEVLEERLFDLPGAYAKRMFGGMCWLIDGRLLCGARSDGLIFRLGKGNDGWALAERGVIVMENGQRVMTGYVRLVPDHCGNDRLRERLLQAALDYVATLPPPAG